MVFGGEQLFTSEISSFFPSPQLHLEKCALFLLLYTLNYLFSYLPIERRWISVCASLNSPFCFAVSLAPEATICGTQTNRNHTHDKCRDASV